MRYAMFVFTTALMLAMTGCGKETPAISTSAWPTETCAKVDLCTQADVAGYSCVTFKKTLDSGACIYASYDFMTDSSCDPSAPTQMCDGGWGRQPYPCCRKIQGPGPAY